MADNEFTLVLWHMVDGRRVELERESADRDVLLSLEIGEGNMWNLPVGSTVRAALLDSAGQEIAGASVPVGAPVVGPWPDAAPAPELPEPAPSVPSVHLSYGLESAFDDVSRAVARNSDPLDYERRFAAAMLLHATVRAGQAIGFPSTPAQWVVDPTDAIIATVRYVEPVDRHAHSSVAQASPLALREVAAELTAGLTVTNSYGPVRRAHKWAEVHDLREHADSIELTARDDLGIDPGASVVDAELADYDARLTVHDAVRADGGDDRG